MKKLRMLSWEGFVALYINHQRVLHIIDTNVNQVTVSIHQKINIWEQFELLTWRWWLGVFCTIVPWVIWYIAARKNRSMDRFLYTGFMVSLIAVALDVAGDQYGLWHYRFNVVPIVPTYFPWDFTLMPIAVIVFLQIKPKGNPFMKSILFALFSSFLGEPIFRWLDIYNPIHWQYVYSVPIQTAIYLAASHFCKTRTKFDPYI